MTNREKKLWDILNKYGFSEWRKTRKCLFSDLTALISEHDKALAEFKAKMPSEEEALQYFNNHFDCYTDVEIDNYTTTEIAMTRSAILKMVEWFRNRMTSSEKPNNLTEGGEG
jgi:hypothetical protein